MNDIASLVFVNAVGAAGLSVVAILATRIVKRPEVVHALWLMVLLSDR